MARNNIIDQCCSVDDLRCHLRNLSPVSLMDKQLAELHIDEAIQHETENGQRVTIIKMVKAKRKSVQKRGNY